MPQSQEAKLKDLYEEIELDPDFESLRRPNIRFVPGTGPMNPDLMLIGEAPGKMENAKCVPFIGTAGSNLNNFLSEAGIPRNRIFLTNLIKYWPLNFNSTEFSRTRPPSKEETDAARDYILEEIDIVNPRIVGLCGFYSLNTVLPDESSIRKVNGHLLHDRFVPLYHPAVISYDERKVPLLREGYMKLGDILKGHPKLGKTG